VIDGDPRIAFHPANVHLAPADTAAENGIILIGTVEGIIDIGARVRFVVALGPGNLIEIEKDIASLSGNCMPKESGEAVSVCIPRDSVIEFKGG